MIFLSPPCVGKEERDAVSAAFDSGYVAPCGPMVDAFERRIAALAGRRCAVAVSSGTAAIDLTMAEWGVDGSFLVIAPTLTFIATVGPAAKRGAHIVFADCDPSGNIDPQILARILAEYTSPAAPLRFAPEKIIVIPVDLYGRCCDYPRISSTCSRFGVKLLVDAAESLGAQCGNLKAGEAGSAAVFSFNGNKIVTTSGGGALVTDDELFAARARKRAQQSRENVLWYEHKEVGSNYRLSNLLASVGLAQLDKLPDFLARRARIKAFYVTNLSGRLDFLPPVPGENNWLTVALAADATERDAIIAALAKNSIESRPFWKPLHLQPVFQGENYHFAGSLAPRSSPYPSLSEEYFARGICLPSGSALTESDLHRISSIVRSSRRPNGVGIDF